MLTTEKTALEQVTSLKRLWQGIPSIAVTKKGRVFLTFYSGGTREQIGNFVVLIKSEDGVNFSEPIAVCYEKEHRCFDPCLWMDPLGRMWLTWSRCPDDGLYAAICDDPDAEELRFGEEFLVGHNIMMNKPTVLSTGEWAFPIAVWDHENGVRVMPKEYDWTDMPTGSYLYKTADQGKTFYPAGYSQIQWRSFDEHQFLEMEDGSIRVFARTLYGIGAADSYDGGAHWSEGYDTGYGGPSSRFFIGRMPSGRVLMINHYKYTGRNNLTAMLSDDDGKTFTHHLLLDGRNNVSYPDVQICEDGTIYICYDRERGGFQPNMAAALNCAREVLYARITEADILAEELVSEGSFLQRIACKLGDYDESLTNPFDKYGYYTDYDCACYLQNRWVPDRVICEVLTTYQVNCSNIHNVEAAELDRLEKAYRQKQDLESLARLIGLVRCASFEESGSAVETVHAIRRYLLENLEGDINMEALAQRFNYSQCYIRHIFKRYTGTTIVEFRKAQRIIKSKLLLVGCDDKITDIAAACGFDNPSYFTEVFTAEVGMSPTVYREINR